MADLATTLQITIRFAWWLKPYVIMLRVIVRLIAPFLGERRASKFIERQSNWLARTGVTYEAEGRHG